MFTLIPDGQTRTETIPAEPGYNEAFTVTFRPLVSWEMDTWRQTKGAAQIDLLASKLQSWNVLANEATALWLRSKGVMINPGDPLPITKAVLGAIPGPVFEVIYLVVMGLLKGSDGKTGIEKQAEQVKN